MEKQKYIVTETAGPFVAGRRSPGIGKPITLTEEEARYPLLSGEIEKPAPRLPAAKPRTRADAVPAEAQTTLEG